MISYYNFSTLEGTRKHTSASDMEKPTTQLPFDYKWLSTNSSNALKIMLLFQNYHQHAYIAIQVVSFEHIPFDKPQTEWPFAIEIN